MSPTNSMRTGCASPAGNTSTIPPRTVKEKVREVLLAIKVERTFEKDTILAKYLNTVYFGHGAYGIEAAAQTYFGVPARRLTVSQSATLAGILTAPEAHEFIGQRRNIGKVVLTT